MTTTATCPPGTISEQHDTNGRLHCDNGPARTLADGTLEWWRHGQLHRGDGPAVERADGTREWRYNGVRHRDDGPAIERANGDREWWIRGQLHRDDGPAIERANGNNEWWVADQLHRLDGPALPAANTWCLYGNKLWAADLKVWQTIDLADRALGAELWVDGLDMTDAASVANRLR